MVITASGLYFLARRLIFGRFLLQVGDELLRGRWHRHGTLEDDVLGSHVFFVKLFVCAVVWADGRPGEGNASEETAGARVGKNLGAHGDVRRSFCVAPLGTGSGGGVGAKFHLAAQNRSSAAFVHDEKNEICSLTTDLESEAAAFEGHHGRSAPRAVEPLTGAAGHGPAAITAAKNKGTFKDGGIDDYAVGFIDKVLRNVVRDIHDLLNDGAAVFQAITLLLV